MTLQQVCAEITRTCLAVRYGETVLLMKGRGKTLRYHTALQEALMQAGAEVSVLEVSLPRAGGAVPPAVGAAMCAANAVVLGTPWIFPHAVRREATAAGARVLSLCTATDGMLRRAGAVDHEVLAVQTRQVAEQIGSASEWGLRTPAGTDLVARIAGRRVIVLDGLARTPGTASGLPAGVVAVIPMPAGVWGRIVIDGSIDGFGLVSEAATVTVADGAVVEISGGPAAAYLRDRFAAAGSTGRWLCEVGTGTNPLARYTGKLLEDERVLGSAHVGFGGNVHLGGELTSELHFDATIRRPSIFLDGQPLVVDGVPVLPDSQERMVHSHDFRERSA